MPPMEDLPASQVVHWPVAVELVPGVEVSPTAHGLQVVAVLPVEAVPPTADVVDPVGQFLQLVAPAAASNAGASTYWPVLQSLHAAATNASNLNFPAIQFVQTLSFPALPVPPIEDVPALHV